MTGELDSGLHRSEKSASPSWGGKPAFVSIVVASYNAAPFLRESLDSMLAQTYPSIEIILMDDASEDETDQIAAEYKGRIKYVRQPTNVGQYDNVNTGIELARGEFIATFHADDVYLPDMVKAQVAYLQANPEVGAVFTSDIFVDAQGCEYDRLVLPLEVRGERPLDYGVVLNTLLTYKNRFLMCPTAMVRADVYRDVGLYRQNRYRNTADLEMWLRIARSYPLAILETHLMKYRHFHNNSSRRYHYLRTDPENFFGIMDEHLEDGGRAPATPVALVNFEAHRSEDRIMAAISHYIKGEIVEGRKAINEVQVDKLLRSRNVQRCRLLLLAAGLWVFLRLPRSEGLARRMLERWHMKKPRKRSTNKRA